MDTVNILRVGIVFPNHTSFQREQLIFASSISKSVYFYFDDDIPLSCLEMPIKLWVHQVIHFPEANVTDNFEFTNIVVGKRINKEHKGIFLLKFGEFGKSYLSVMPSLQNKFPVKVVLVNMDGYCLSLFMKYLSCSQNYINQVNNYIKYHSFYFNRLQGEKVKIVYSNLRIICTDPLRHVIDLKSAKMACAKLYELCQLRYTMSWLSTLGGAFSALGEEQKRCAKAAGMISIEQLCIAMKLGDDIVVAQCKLYFSLSLIQQGRCRLAKKIIEEQFFKMKNAPVVDKKTLNMCKGIWARLKYEKLMKRRAKECKAKKKLEF